MTPTASAIVDMLMSPAVGYFTYTTVREPREDLSVPAYCQVKGARSNRRNIDIQQTSFTTDRGNNQQ